MDEESVRKCYPIGQKKRCSCFHKWLHPRLVSNMIRFIKLIGLSSALTIEVEGFVYFFLRGSLVDADVADATEQSEVDAARRVLLVMRHEFEKDGVVIAGDGHATVVFVDETDGLAHLVGGEAGLDGAQVELADEAKGDGIAVKDRGVVQGKRLKGVANGVAEVKRLADAVFQGVFGNDALFDGHTVGQHALKE